VKSDQAALSRRFGKLGEYDVKDEAVVLFRNVGSAVLSEEVRPRARSRRGDREGPQRAI
jgi:hypothetical protein